MKVCLINVLSGIFVIVVIVKFVNIKVMVFVCLFSGIKLVVIVVLIEKKILCENVVIICVISSSLKFVDKVVIEFFMIKIIINSINSDFLFILFVKVVNMGVLNVIFIVYFEINNFVSVMEIFKLFVSDDNKFIGINFVVLILKVLIVSVNSGKELFFLFCCVCESVFIF